MEIYGTCLMHSYLLIYCKVRQEIHHDQSVQDFWGSDHCFWHSSATAAWLASWGCCPRPQRLAVAKPHHKIWCCWWVPLPAFLGKAVRNLLTMIFHSWLPCGMLTLCSVSCDIPLKFWSFEEFHDGAQNHKNSSTGAPHSKVQTISQNLWPNPKNTPGFAGNYIYICIYHISI